MTLEIHVIDYVRVFDIIPNIKRVFVRVVKFARDLGKKLISTFVPNNTEGRAPPVKITGFQRKEVVAKKG